MHGAYYCSKATFRKHNWAALSVDNHIIMISMIKLSPSEREANACVRLMWQKGFCRATNQPVGRYAFGLFAEGIAPERVETLSAKLSRTAMDVSRLGCSYTRSASASSVNGSGCKSGQVEELNLSRQFISKLSLLV